MDSEFQRLRQTIANALKIGAAIIICDSRSDRTRQSSVAYQKKMVSDVLALNGFEATLGIYQVGGPDSPRGTGAVVSDIRAGVMAVIATSPDNHPNDSWRIICDAIRSVDGVLLVNDQVFRPSDPRHWFLLMVANAFFHEDRRYRALRSLR